MAVSSTKDELLDLLGALCNGSITPEEDQRLGLLLGADPNARRLYVRYLDVHLALTDLDLVSHDACDDLASSLIAGLDASDADEPYLSSVSRPELAERSTFMGSSVFPTLHQSIDPWFSSGWPVAYLVATVIFGIGLVIGAIVHVSQPISVVQRVTPLPSPLSPHPSSESVARITGMVDCVWEDSGFRVQGSGNANHASEIRNRKSAIRLDDRLDVRSGLLEITYDTGAKVILQGPVTYEVDSPVGGYLALGKLTARLEKRSEVRGQRSEVRDQEFAVRTPTAMVTDLGTEFSVEVDAEGQSSAHVFRGSVRVQATSRDGIPQGDGRVLSANQSARVERDGKTSGSNPVIHVEPSGKPPAFVRKIPRRAPKALDLVDVVAGGNGVSGRRARGIDPTTGQPIFALWTPDKKNVYLPSDSEYHRLRGMPFIDGVFIPDGTKESVQIDSTGRRFAGFRGAADLAGQFIWAGGPMPPYPTEIAGVDYTSSGHGMLLLHANNAITFDLDAIRDAYPQAKVLRFHGWVANVEIVSARGEDAWADAWVIIDGKERFKRRELTSWSGALRVAVPIAPRDRFLTLAATDGGNGLHNDWIVFCDPRLELVTTEGDESEHRKDGLGPKEVKQQAE